jgi:hypothetical protein
MLPPPITDGYRVRQYENNSIWIPPMLDRVGEEALRAAVT